MPRYFIPSDKWLNHLYARTSKAYPSPCDLQRSCELHCLLHRRSHHPAGKSQKRFTPQQIPITSPVVHQQRIPPASLRRPRPLNPLPKVWRAHSHRRQHDLLLRPRQRRRLSQGQGHVTQLNGTKTYFKQTQSCPLPGGDSAINGQPGPFALYALQSAEDFITPISGTPPSPGCISSGFGILGK
jgi:hypothetical protein